MKLVRRLTVFLLAAFALVLAADTWWSVRSHLGLFDDDIRRDQGLLAHAMARAVERVWTLGGEGEARALLAEINSADAETRASLVPAQAGAAAAPRGPGHRVRFEGNQKRLETTVALELPARSGLALQLSESFAHERAYALARVGQAVGTALAAVLVCGLVAWTVGVRVVGRPIEQLVAKARRIARRDFGQPLALRPETELSMLAREMNGMAASLDAASREIAEQSAARIAAQEQLRHADRLTTVGKLASGLAHELGTPLNVVAGRAKMIASGEASESAEVRECARVIAAQADRMTALVRELLDFARRRGGEKRPVDLSALVRQTAGLLEPLGAKRGVEVRAEAPEAAVIAHADASQIQQAVMNLVMNAIHASLPGGGVVVRVRAGGDGLPERALRLGPCAVIEVADSGAGIPPELIEQVFDPFFTTKAPGEGTGLGLSVAYGIVEDHGGWIDVQSELKRGSRFRIGLPLASA
ncbi:MAG TPA: HAMP domain-containing sensor histidine kinase [Myxococcota bacterium]|jgi:signal transduction histidine kinase